MFDLDVNNEFFEYWLLLFVLYLGILVVEMNFFIFLLIINFFINCEIFFFILVCWLIFESVIWNGVWLFLLFEDFEDDLLKDFCDDFFEDLFEGVRFCDRDCCKLLLVLLEFVILVE